MEKFPGKLGSEARGKTGKLAKKTKIFPAF